MYGISPRKVNQFGLTWQTGGLGYRKKWPYKNFRQNHLRKWHIKAFVYESHRNRILGALQTAKTACFWV